MNPDDLLRAFAKCQATHCFPGLSRSATASLFCASPITVGSNNEKDVSSPDDMLRLFRFLGGGEGEMRKKQRYALVAPRVLDSWLIVNVIVCFLL